MKKKNISSPAWFRSACSSRVEKVTSHLEGMAKASVNLLTNSMQVEYDEAKLTASQICQAVSDAGYGASLAPDPLGNPAAVSGPVPTTAVAMAAAASTALRQRLSLSLLFLVPLLYVAMHNMLARFGQRYRD